MHLAHAGQHQQRERHDRQAAELHQRAAPDIRHAAPAQRTFSSTIMTRFSVPISSTSAMPTVTWNSDSRSRRDNGKSGVAASAKGRNVVPMLTQDVITLRLSLFMAVAHPNYRGRRLCRPGGAGKAQYGISARQGMLQPGMVHLGNTLKAPGNDRRPGSCDPGLLVMAEAARQNLPAVTWTQNSCSAPAPRC